MISLKTLKKICLVIAIEHALIISSAHAATITVTNTGDTDGNDQACTLREAIQSIHDLDTKSSGCVKVGSFGANDTIVFAPDLINQQIQLNQDLPLLITKDLFINGLGADHLTIDGTFNRPAGIFEISGSSIQGGVNVRIDNLTISGGRSPSGGAIGIDRAELSLGNSIISGNSSENAGGGLQSNHAIVHLTDSTISGNSASGGGGIYAGYSTLNLVNSSVSDNTCDGSGGGLYVFYSDVNLSLSNVSGNVANSDTVGGGAFFNFEGTINPTNSILSNNVAIKGGAIRSAGGVVNFVDSTISSNTAINDGGAISVGGGGIVNFTDSTITSNTAGNYGGAVYVRSGATLNLLTSTISGNSAEKFGGGISSLGGEVNVKTSTISGNNATQGGGGVFFGSNDPDTPLKIAQSTIVNNFTNDDGGGIALVGDGAVVFVTNSILAGNVAANNGDETAQFGGTFNFNGFNVLGDSSNTNAMAFAGFSPDLAGYDIIATSNGTLPTALTSILDTTLKNNGGPTKTHALVIGSPAIDAGFLCNSTDQRGVVRLNLSTGGCDIGSFELNPLIFSNSFE